MAIFLKNKKTNFDTSGYFNAKFGRNRRIKNKGHYGGSHCSSHYANRREEGGNSQKFRKLAIHEFLDSLLLTHNPDVFLETLILCVKNNALQEQKRAIKIKNLKKSELISRVKSLKKVNIEDRNNSAIFRAESALSNFVEKELKFELEKNLSF